MSTSVKTIWANVFGLKFRVNISTFSDLFKKSDENFSFLVGMNLYLEIREVSISTFFRYVSTKTIENITIYVKFGFYTPFWVVSTPP